MSVYLHLQVRDEGGNVLVSDASAHDRAGAAGESISLGKIGREGYWSLQTDTYAYVRKDDFTYRFSKYGGSELDVLEWLAKLLKLTGHVELWHVWGSYDQCEKKIAEMEA